jgi:hypothetical protein
VATIKKQKRLAANIVLTIRNIIPPSFSPDTPGVFVLASSACIVIDQLILVNAVSALREAGHDNSLVLYLNFCNANAIAIVAC